MEKKWGRRAEGPRTFGGRSAHASRTPARDDAGPSSPELNPRSTTKAGRSRDPVPSSLFQTLPSRGTLNVPRLRWRGTPPRDARKPPLSSTKWANSAAKFSFVTLRTLRGVDHISSSFSERRRFILIYSTTVHSTTNHPWTAAGDARLLILPVTTLALCADPPSCRAASLQSAVAVAATGARQFRSRCRSQFCKFFPSISSVPHLPSPAVAFPVLRAPPFSDSLPAK